MFLSRGWWVCSQKGASQAATQLASSNPRNNWSWMWFKMLLTALERLFRQEQISSLTDFWRDTLFSASHNKDYSHGSNFPSSRRHQGWELGGTGTLWMETEGSSLWFDPQNAPQMQPQRPVLVSVCSSSFPQHWWVLTTGDSIPILHLCICFHAPALLMLIVVIYLVLLSSQIRHQQLLTTHPSTSQKKECHKTQKRIIWWHREEQEGNKHQPVPFYNLRLTHWLHPIQDALPISS